MYGILKNKEMCIKRFYIKFSKRNLEKKSFKSKKHNLLHKNVNFFSRHIQKNHKSLFETFSEHLPVLRYKLVGGHACTTNTEEPETKDCCESEATLGLQQP